MSILPAQDIEKAPGDDQTYSIDLTIPLNGRTITSADSTTSPSGITLANEAVQTSSYDTDDASEDGIPSYTVAASKAVLIDISGGSAKSIYVCSVTVTMSDSKTLEVPFRVVVKDGTEKGLDGFRIIKP